MDIEGDGRDGAAAPPRGGGARSGGYRSSGGCHRAGADLPEWRPATGRDAHAPGWRAAATDRGDRCRVWADRSQRQPGPAPAHQHLRVAGVGARGGGHRVPALRQARPAGHEGPGDPSGDDVRRLRERRLGRGGGGARGLPQRLRHRPQRGRQPGDSGRLPGHVDRRPDPGVHARPRHDDDSARAALAPARCRDAHAVRQRARPIPPRRGSRRAAPGVAGPGRSGEPPLHAGLGHAGSRSRAGRRADAGADRAGRHGHPDPPHGCPGAEGRQTGCAAVHRARCFPHTQGGGRHADGHADPDVHQSGAAAGGGGGGYDCCVCAEGGELAAPHPHSTSCASPTGATSSHAAGRRSVSARRCRIRFASAWRYTSGASRTRS